MTCFLPTPQVLDLLYFAVPARRGLAATTCDLFFHPGELDSKPPHREARRSQGRRVKARLHVHEAALRHEFGGKLAGGHAHELFVCNRGDQCVRARSEEHTSELQSHSDLVCRLLLEKKKPSFRPSSYLAS